VALAIGRSAGDTRGQAWAGPFRDADGNGVMEFAPATAPLPPGRWTHELNFLAWQPAEGTRTADLPAGARIRLSAPINLWISLIAFVLLIANIYLRGWTLPALGVGLWFLGTRVLHISANLGDTESPSHGIGWLIAGAVTWLVLQFYFIRFWCHVFDGRSRKSAARHARRKARRRARLAAVKRFLYAEAPATAPAPAPVRPKGRWVQTVIQDGRVRLVPAPAPTVEEGEETQQQVMDGPVVVSGPAYVLVNRAGQVLNRPDTGEPLRYDIKQALWEAWQRVRLQHPKMSGYFYAATVDAYGHLSDERAVLY